MCILYHVVDITKAGYFFTVPMAYEAVHAWSIGDEGGYSESDIIRVCDGVFSIEGKSKSSHTHQVSSPRGIRSPESFHDIGPRKTQHCITALLISR